MQPTPIATEAVRQQVEGLYGENGPSLLSYFRRHHGAVGVAEDLLQDTFLQAMLRPERLLAAASPRAYLFGIARHLNFEVLRKRRPEEELPDELAAKEQETTDPRLEQMRAAIAILPEMQREILELRLVHELSYGESAVALNIPVGTVRSRLHLAVAKLRDTLKS